ncbi:Uncharacterized protein YigI [Olavius algarvensis associated proteobacterium Delta 3]|nr:Uncharacterized protein YigI [Olavius algarvensis associated proteobacterium Delta 3]CAB5135211.1 Uncharacterized protein YigI [Olavius algarvensis associated proteobacterium Delta 3]
MIDRDKTGSPEAPGPENQVDALLDIVRDLYEEKIPFNRVLGMRVETISAENVGVRFEMTEALIGNFVLKTLHGGVISAVLDATGGMTASVGVLRKMHHRPLEEIAERFTRIGTIDLRVDYLRPGRGAFFRASGTIMRTGNKVAVTRMALHNDSDVLIAVGTGTYLVG